MATTCASLDCQALVEAGVDADARAVTCRVRQKDRGLWLGVTCLLY